MCSSGGLKFVLILMVSERFVLLGLLVLHEERFAILVSGCAMFEVQRILEPSPPLF